MNKYFFIIFTIAISFNSNGQENSVYVQNNKFILGFDGGIAIPNGDFFSRQTSQVGLTNNGEIGLSGSAENGFGYDAYGGFRFSKFFGIMVQYGTNYNSFNTSDLGNSSSASGGYHVVEYLGGPYLSIIFGKIIIEGKLLGGKLTINYPSLTIINNINSIIDIFQNGSGFGYYAGAKIKYMLLRGKLGIGVGVNYLGSDVEYPSWTQYYYSHSIYSFQSPQGSIKMSVDIIQFTLGGSIAL